MKITRLFAILAVALLGTAIFAGAAQAASCPYYGATKVFAPWNDQRNYVLAPDGGFEAGAKGWTLSRGAAVVPGNESYYLNGQADKNSLSLPAGSEAVSPAICMSLDTPVFRMVARNSGDPRSQLRVTASYKLLGLVRTQTIATVTGTSAWAPTAPHSTVLTLSTIIGTLIPSAIEIRVQPLDSKGKWQVDNLYIDPFSRR